MTNKEMRNIVERLDINLFKINYKTGVHYGIIEDFFGGKTEELAPKDRERIETMLKAEWKKYQKSQRGPLYKNKKVIAVAAGVAVVGIAAFALTRKK